MTVRVLPGRRPLVYGLSLALLAVLVPVQPVVANEIAPETRNATLRGVERMLDADTDATAAEADGDATAAEDGAAVAAARARGPEAKRSGAIEAPIPFVGLGIRGSGDEPELRIRTLDLDGQWSAWTEVELLDRFDGPDPGSAEADAATLDVTDGAWSTDAIWAGPSSHLQLEVAGADPDEVEVVFTDTAGLSETWVERVSRAVRSRNTAAPAEASTATGGAPNIRPRSDWLPVEHRSGTASAATVRFAVLHHTATKSDYTPEQVPQQIRNMHNWHTEHNGWADLGYNFVIDRFGTIWEGRYGGITRGVVGAHAGGWNTGSFGVAIMGNLNDVQPDPRSLASAARLIGWKYAVHGIDPDPASRVSVNGHSIRRLEGHRNVRATYIEWQSGTSFQQDCPGANMSWRLPTLRDAIAQEYEAVAARTGPFLDVPATHDFAEAIRWMKTNQVSTGYDDGTFRPMVEMTRQGIVQFLWQLAGSPRVSGASGFSDVPASHPFSDAITWAVQEGITSGYDDGTFRPQDTVLRQAAAIFLYRAAGEPGGAWTSDFSDVPPSHPFARAIAWMASNGITSGYPDGTFGAELPVRRQAVARFLHEASKLG